LPREEKSRLVRAVGPWGLTAIAVNGMVGAGIFVMPATVAALLGAASPAAYWVAGAAAIANRGGADQRGAPIRPMSGSAVVEWSSPGIGRGGDMRIVFLLTLAAAAAVAQDPVSEDMRGLWNGVKNNVARAAEKMPEEHYSFKPSPDVRSFGQLIGHIADAQFSICAASLGEARGPAGIEKSKTSKAELAAALKESIEYCDKAYAALTQANAAEAVKIFGRERTRISGLAMNISHSNEHYGNIVTYMRIKGLVPPSSEPRPR
jgi:uncharacterized damage-inducible protein DinB